MALNRTDRLGWLAREAMESVSLAQVWATKPGFVIVVVVIIVIGFLCLD